MFGSGLKLNITKIGAAISKFLRSFGRVVENQNLSGRVAKHDWDPAFLAFVGLDLVEHFAVAFGVETQDSPIVNLQQESSEGLRVDVVARFNLTDVEVAARLRIVVERSGFGNELQRVRPRGVNHPFWLITCQVVFGELSAETIIPGNVDERLNRSWTKNAFWRPRLSRTTVRIFFD